jgi:hypothetical protein
MLVDPRAMNAAIQPPVYDRARCLFRYVHGRMATREAVEKQDWLLIGNDVGDAIAVTIARLRHRRRYDRTRSS